MCMTSWLAKHTKDKDELMNVLFRTTLLTSNTVSYTKYNSHIRL